MIVETGIGIADANSYADIDFADTFHADRGNASWAEASQVKREQALIRATDYIDRNYIFSGVALSKDQALQAPRLEGSMKPVVRATAMLALIILDDGEMQRSEDQNITQKSVEIAGAIKESVTYDSVKSSDQFEQVTLELAGTATRKAGQPARVVRLI